MHPAAAGCHKRYATAKQRRDVEAYLRNTPEVTEVRFVGRAAAYRGFVEAFKDNEALVKATRVSDMPESYLLWLRPGVDRESPRRRLAGLPGVSTVTAQQCRVRETRFSAEYGLVKTDCG